jgi:fructose-1,6-bisphosphatase/inositol monophosphatase family enzyme
MPLMSLADPDKVANIVAQVAADVILPRFCRLKNDEIHEKNPGDLVTVADREAEQRLIELLPPLLPGSLVIGEECVSADPGNLDCLAGDAPVWVIDPIDGTGNFVRGNQNFAVIVALVRGQETLQGWIYDPLLAQITYAVKGGGTWCGGTRRLLESRPVSGMIGSVARGDHDKLTERGLKVRQFGSAAHEYLALLDGSLDFSCYRRLHPWDHAAGTLMIAEAGGKAATLDGKRYRPLPQPGNSLLMAPDEGSWETLRELLGN